MCAFYETQKDKLDIVSSYFKFGLENNELGIWTTSEETSAADAEAALRKIVPDFNARAARGQIKIVPYTEWFFKNDVFDVKKAINLLLEEYHQGVGKGFRGLRFSGCASWAEKAECEELIDYEKKLDHIINQNRIIVLCTYPLENLSVSELISAAFVHQLALIKQGNRWAIIENAASEHAGIERKRVHALEEHCGELEAMNRAMIGRELKMLELKNELEELKNKIPTSKNGD